MTLAAVTTREKEWQTIEHIYVLELPQVRLRQPTFAVANLRPRYFQKP